jgi:phosphatidylglycerophosphate synthase
MSKYKKGEALPMEEGLYNNLAPKIAPFLYEKLGLTPNMITTIGLVMGLVLIYTFAIKDYTTTAILMIIRQILDGLDGYIARTYNLQSEFGKKYDQYSDKIVHNMEIFLTTLTLFQYSPIGSFFFLVIYWVLQQVNKQRFRCIRRTLKECKDEETRHFFLTKTKSVSAFDLQTLLALFIFSFNFYKK